MAIYLPSVPMGNLPDIPTGDDEKPFVDLETVENRKQAGDYLLIIAGDQLDPRVVRLSEALLGKHLASLWNLALVEVAVFRQQTEFANSGHLLVPHLRGALVADERQVVRVIVEGDHTRVEVQPTAPVSLTQKWDEERFFLQAGRAAAPLRDFANELVRLRQSYSGLSFDFGTSKGGSLILKKSGSNILELRTQSRMVVAPSSISEKNPATPVAVTFKYPLLYVSIDFHRLCGHVGGELQQTKNRLPIIEW